MTLTTIVLLVLALYFFQVFLQEITRHGINLRSIVGNRDVLPSASPLAGRLDRARNNMLEALPIFLGLALMAMVRLGDNPAVANGALVFLIARLAYVPAYASGLPWLRSLIWLAGNGGLVAMAIPLIGAG